LAAHHWETFLNTLNTPTDPLKRDRMARLRFSIIGPLLAAPPEPGSLQAELIQLSSKTWCHPLD